LWINFLNQAAFLNAGFEDTESQTNFLFVDVKQPTKEFAAACQQDGVRIGRPFPPLETHAHISLGTMEEMQQATKVFAKILGVSANQAA
jgi:histidinol-phosphate aminotransferase